MVNVGARVRLVRLIGVASDAMREYIGKRGTVRRVAERANGIEVEVAFPAAIPGDVDTYWLRAGEFEEVSVDAIVPPEGAAS